MNAPSIRSASFILLAFIFVVLSLAGSAPAAEIPRQSNSVVSDELTNAVQSAESEAPRWAGFVERDFPFFSSVLDARKLGDGLPANNLTPRGIILNLGSDCWACFDTDLLRMSAIWSGEGVSPASMSQGSYQIAGRKASAGQDKLPQILGNPWLASGIYPGWQTNETVALTDPREAGEDEKEIGRGPLAPAMGQFKAIRIERGGTCLEYDVFGMTVREWTEARPGTQPVIQRRFQFDRVDQPLWLVLGRKPSSAAHEIRTIVSADKVRGMPAAELIERPDGLLAVRVKPSKTPVEFRVAFGRGGSVKTWKAASEVKAHARWPEVAVTQGTQDSRKEAYVTDNISLPLENPWKRNVRLADIAFFKDGLAAVVTFDGDVWLVSGLDGELRRITWKRFTSGLHEPLSICVRDGELFVFDRNGIWRLRDTNGDDEADAHELFSNAFGQTAETREFATGMRVGPDGSFCIAKGGQQGATIGKHNGTILRVSPDGKSADVLGWGLRQPFFGVNPKTGLVTASDQQGHYVPTTPLHIIAGHQYYGFVAKLFPKEKYPATIADPLTWIPHAINASGAGQVWLMGARMGPLNEALIHIGYNRPELFVVLLNERLPKMQGAVVSLAHEFEFAPLAGAVNPRDGQLYVSGFQIWGTTANQISGLARIRYTGEPCTLPRSVVPMDKGILLSFNVPLEETRALNPANFSVERWNYQRSPNYGSPHFKMDGSKGQDNLVPSSAYLSRDRKSVFIGIPGMRPAMQMRLGWSLATEKAATFEQNAYFTPHELMEFKPAAEGFEPITVDLTPRKADLTEVATVSVEEGRRFSELMGCVACHSLDGSTLGKSGPTWKGLFGSERALAGNASVVADETYLRESILEPAAKIVSGFEKSDVGMPSYEGVISIPQLDSLLLYIKTLR